MPCPSEARQRSSRFKSKRRMRHIGACVNCGQPRDGSSKWRCVACALVDAAKRRARYWAAAFAS